MLIVIIANQCNRIIVFGNSLKLEYLHSIFFFHFEDRVFSFLHKSNMDTEI